jgi:hypothetical protein
MTQSIKARKQKPKALTLNRIKIKTERPPLEANRMYNRAEAALACGVAYLTIVRAKESGELACFKVGRRVLHNGQQLLDWLKSKEERSAKR